MRSWVPGCGGCPGADAGWVKKREESGITKMEEKLKMAGRKKKK
jgi:hypothetical protein